MYNLRRRIPNDRFIGAPFIGPFILGGITGGLLAPAFYRPQYPIYYTPQTPPPPPFYNYQF